ncbi:MAG: chemotaxis protein CheW [Rhizobiaceae bacterium]
MLFLLFSIGDGSFALATDAIVEVVPLLDLKTMRQAPAGVSGLLEYRGRFVPVVDLSALELGRPAQRRLSTRIVVMSRPGVAEGLIGLIVEKATETIKLDPADFAPFAKGPDGLVQRVDLESLVPPALLAALPGQPAVPA